MTCEDGGGQTLEIFKLKLLIVNCWLLLKGR